MLSKCTGCGLCDAYCPTYRVSKREEFSPRARLRAARDILSGSASRDHLAPIFSCTQCGLCARVCPEGVDIPALVELCRVELHERGLAPLPQHREIIASVLELGNSVKKPREEKWSWLPDRYLYLFEKKSPTLLFVGCLPSYLTKEVAATTVELLSRLGIDFRLLREEICCGAPLFNYGDRVDAERIVEANARMFEREGIENIVVMCPGCYRTFERRYGGFEVVHVVQLLYDLYEAGEVEFRGLGTRLTYHDPCHLSREYGFYEEPRALLEAVGELVEMEECREWGLCCGADAGVRPAFKDLSVSLALERLRQAKKVAEIVVTACPFCLFNLNYANLKLELGMRVAYLTELLLEACRGR